MKYGKKENVFFTYKADPELDQKNDVSVCSCGGDIYDINENIGRCLDCGKQYPEPSPVTNIFL